MNKINWTQVAVFGVVALLVFLLGASLLSGGWGGGPWGSWGPGGMMGRMMGGWGPGGMMGGWGFGPLAWLPMLLGLVFPLGLLALLALGVVWLVRQVGGPVAGPPQAPAGQTCPNCGRPVQADWRLCPHCGQELA